MTEFVSHPDRAALEALRTHEADAEVRAHVAACAACRMRAEAWARWVDDLRWPEAPPASAPMPPAVRSAVDAAVRRSGRGRRLRRYGLWAGAMAAAIPLVLWFSDLAAPPQGTDFNRDGQVDVADAWWLRKQLRAGAQDPAFDVNKDARVDEGDVRALMHQLVRLEAA